MGCALVTGASSGLGEEFCWQLAAARHDVVLVARREERLESLADQLRQVAGVGAEVLVADLASADGRARVADRLALRERRGDLRPVDLLVNNAGFGLGGPFLDLGEALDPDDATVIPNGGGLRVSRGAAPASAGLDHEREGLAVMVQAVMELSHAAATSMVTRRRGAILNVASVAADTGGGTYSAHKAWVRAFTEGLAEELRGTGVTATCVSPGLTRTEFHEIAGTPMDGTPSWMWASPEAVVEAALAGVRHGRVLVTPTVANKVAASALRHAPRWAIRAAMRHLPHQ